jgi:hypothetical protein
MVSRERLIKQDEGKERQGVRTQEDQQNSNSRKTYLEFLSKRSSTSRQNSSLHSQLKQAMGGVKFPQHVVIQKMTTSTKGNMWRD